jgi:hypothetical protein
MEPAAAHHAIHGTEYLQRKHCSRSASQPSLTLFLLLLLLPSCYSFFDQQYIAAAQFDITDAASRQAVQQAVAGPGQVIHLVLPAAAMGKQQAGRQYSRL